MNGATSTDRATEAKSLGYLMGVDLGQASDYTAISIVERVTPAGAKLASTVSQRTVAEGMAGYMALHSRHDKSTTEYHIRHLERPDLGTTYPRIADRVKVLTRMSPLTPQTKVVIDRTGVGVAVTDIFREAGIATHAITITGGDQVIHDGGKHTKVPKRELVGQLVALFHSGRLKVAEDLEHAPTLINELVNFKVKINLATGHDSYEAWRESIHDDLVLSVALACWYGENIRTGTLISW